MLPVLLVAMQAMAPADSGRFAPVTRIMDAAIANRAFPGGVVAIGTRDSVLFLGSFGRHDYERGPAVTTRTVYDIASLTKVVGLTTAIMMLVDERVVDLDAPVRGYVQLFGYQHDSTVHVRHLLTHSSGLPAWRPFYQRARNREDMFAMAAGELLEAPVGTRMVYSDLGAINLTAMVEALTAERIDRFLKRRLFDPLRMRDTRFTPPRSWRGRIAPTERDTTWRRRLIHGEVHDENAYAMGGVSGHAGLFSTAPDLARFAQWMLGCFSHAPRTTHLVSVSCETVQMFTQRQDSAFSTRALGWDTPDGQNSAGTRFSSRSFGHTGFTGTSIWMDPRQDLFVVLLTNRVYPTRENRRIFEVRRALADAAVTIVREALIVRAEPENDTLLARVVSGEVGAFRRRGPSYLDSAAYTGGRWMLIVGRTANPGGPGLRLTGRLVNLQTSVIARSAVVDVPDSRWQPYAADLVSRLLRRE